MLTFNNFSKISIVLAATIFHSLPVFAEAGAKAMFADDTASVMMSDDSSAKATTTKVTKPAPVLAKKSRVSDDSDYTENEADMVSTSYSGIQYWIDLQEHNGRAHKVTTSHIFRSGDSIKLQIKSKTSGYLYVLNQDESGKVTPLYQSVNQIQPNAIYTIPQRGAIRFDNVTGNEKVTIALSKYPIPSMMPSSAPSLQSPMTNVSYSDCSNSSSAGSKGMFTEETTPSYGMECLRKNHNAGSKGMFAEEDSNSLEPASYSVVPTNALEAGDVLFVDFSLTHR